MTENWDLELGPCVSGAHVINYHCTALHCTTLQKPDQVRFRCTLNKHGHI